jgi:hypothetical protein
MTIADIPSVLGLLEVVVAMISVGNAMSKVAIVV